MLQVTTQPRDQALSLFEEALHKGWLYRLLARLRRHKTRLLELNERLCCAVAQNTTYTGLRSVAVKQIRGTLGKATEFDAGFHPLSESDRSRWVAVARLQLSGGELPPVELTEVEGIYYVRDGHHRVSVAQSLGQAYIDAEVIRIRLV